MHGHRSTKSVHRITKSDLLSLLDKSTFEMLCKVIKSEFGFIYFLEKRNYRGNGEEQILEIIIKILGQIFSSKSTKVLARRNKLIRMLEDCKEFLFEDTPNVINSSFSRNAGISLVSFMADYMDILTTLLRKELFSCAIIVNKIFPAMENYMNRLHENKTRSLESAEANFNNLLRAVENFENPVSDDDDQGINDFRELSVVPHENEIINCENLYIPHNIIDRPYKSVDHFLSVHYRLIREDMFRSFRECVKQSNNEFGQGTYSMSKNKVYENVFVVSSPEYTIEGICYELKVTTLKDVDWAKKEILLPGSLVILTSDSFRSIIVATIKNNPKTPSSRSKECRIKIKLEDDVFFRELATKVYKMIEPDAYFEGYRHVLSGIKAFDESNFPLSDILAYLEYSDPEPEYLDKKMYCLHEKCGGLFEHNDSHDCKVFNPLKDDEWPALEDLDKLKLDEQQYMAFKTAITKKVAIIQGPPGTGKTHVGVKIVQTLLENETRKPIVICCLTNHALDHILEDIMKHTKKIVRLGSQSKSESIEPHKLEKLLYAVGQHRQGNKLDKTQQKSLDIVKEIASTILETKAENPFDPHRIELYDLCCKINAHLLSLSLCTNKYLEDSALNDIVDTKFKNQLRNTPGSIKKSLSSSILEWLVCSRSSDLYEKCCKYFNSFEKKLISIPKFQIVWGLTETKRFEVFYCWRKKCLEIIKKNLEYDVEEYKKLIRMYKGRPVNPDELEIVRSASIVGATTTGACKFKDLIRMSEPHIMIIEEAAQVLEAHVIASLVHSIQHLILIGDHEQLRPLPANNELSEKYNLKISMFERLFRNDAPSATLVCQHRMKPCIADLLVPYPYTQYTSGQRVYEYEEIRGVQSSAYFFDHRVLEDNTSGTSLSNEFEAKMIVSLAKYFCMQSYSLQKITIIATYAAQVALIIKYLSKENLSIQVTTVDNFQGEENDIILVSFVRSNPSTIGFLKESNRVCVALSRAKMGLFCFGNFELFSNKNHVWKSIIDKAHEKNMVGDFLMLKCNKHKTTQSVRSKEDIEKFINSGCSEMCNFLLPCQHRCVFTCHFKDPEHLHYLCQQTCTRMIDENRVCSRLCYKKCKRIKKKEVELPCGHFSSVGDAVLCFKEVQRVLICQHIITVPCYLNVQQYKCEAIVNVDLICGHTKQVQCHEQKVNNVCTELKPQMGACGHNIYVPCSLHMDGNDLIPFCDKSCGALLDCGHPCLKLCRECFDIGIHGLCNEKCELDLSCGHKCKGNCNRPCPPCNQKCSLTCAHNTTCINECLRPCVKCEQPCERKCKHKCCSKQCYEECNVKPCMEPCSEVLPCGHLCIGLCGDPCLCYICCRYDFNEDISEDNYYVELPCNDIIEVNALNEHIECCLTTFDWPCCPKCSEVITHSVRYKEALMQAKKYCIDSCDTSKYVLDIQYLVDIMYGEDYNPPATFLPVHNKIREILKKKKPCSDSLTILKNCVMLLSRLVNIASKLIDLGNEHMQNKFDTLLKWISDHLTIASFQQLRELESVIELFVKQCPNS